MDTESLPLCPHCGQFDMVRKVSSIVAEGIQVKQEEYDGRSIGGMGIIALSYYLMKKLETSGIYNVVIILLLFLIAATVNRKLLPLLFPAIRKAIEYERNPRKADKDYREYLIQRQKIEKAGKWWLKLCYCSRCDGVFTKEENEFVPSDGMRYYIFRDRDYEKS